jgi:predicted Fe-Mo cluster-binding NifX family protein
MRVAVATDNGRSPALHAGRARSFHIYDVDEDMKVIKREERPNPHRELVMERHRAGLHRDGEGQGKMDGSGMGRGAGRGPGCGTEHGTGHGRGHDVLFRAISDCNILMARGMGRHLADEAEARGIRPIVTGEMDILVAVEALAHGRLEETGRFH